MRIVGFALVALAVAAPALALDYDQPVTLSAAEKTAIQRDVRKGLKDPESARFGGMVARKNAKGVTFVCGLVNAKNSYGGYTGMQYYNGILLHPSKKPVGFAVVGIGEAPGLVCAEHGMAVER